MFKAVLEKLHNKAGNHTPRKDKEITYSHPSVHREERYLYSKNSVYGEHKAAKHPGSEKLH